MSTIYDPTLNIMSNLSTLFSTDNNQQVPKTETPVQQGQTPKVDQPDYGKTWNLISTTLTPDSQHWGRKEWRNWRKQQGLSKQEMRNVRAAALSGRQAPVNVSRRELREMENLMGTQGYTRAIGQADQKMTGLANALNGITNWSGKVNTDPIEIEEEIIEEAPLPGQVPAPAPAVTPVSTITYDWGDKVNAYWKDQNEKVLKALPEEQLRQFDANKDNKLDPNELMAWQQSIGAGNDLKFGSGTIGAASAKYGNSFNASGFKGYTNPGNTQTKDNGSPVKSTSGNPVHTNNGTSINTTGTGVMGSTNLMYEWGKKINNWWNSL